MGKKCPLLGCTVCVCFDTSAFQKSDPCDYRWTLTGERSIFSIEVEGEEKEKHILMQFSMDTRQKGQKRFVYSWVPVAWLIVEHIKNQFCPVNWTQIYLKLNESQHILPGPLCLGESIVVDYFLSFKMQFWSQFTRKLIHHHPISCSLFGNEMPKN